MKPDRKIPQKFQSLESSDIHHFVTSRSLNLPYRERVYIIVRRFKKCRMAVHSALVIDIRALLAD